MPDEGEPGGVAVQEATLDAPAGHEVKNPNERYLPLGRLTEYVIRAQQKLLSETLDEQADRLSTSSKDRITQQLRELEDLSIMAERIKNGEPLVPFDHKDAPEDDHWTTSLRLVKEGSKLKTADRGGVTILNLQYVRAREGESSLDETYSQGLRGKDPQSMKQSPHFHPQAQETIYVHTMHAYMDPATGRARFKPQAGFALMYNRGETSQVKYQTADGEVVTSVPTARVGATTYQGFTPYPAETNLKVFMPQFEQVKKTITSGS